MDQIELIRIKDVYIQQSMIGDWLGIGNVVLISSEHTLPKAYLLGIEDPRRLMDLIWHHMRLEQAQKTEGVPVRVTSVAGGWRVRSRSGSRPPRAHPSPQYVGRLGSTSWAQARMPPLRFLSWEKPADWSNAIALALRTPLLQWTTMGMP